MNKGQFKIFILFFLFLTNFCFTTKAGTPEKKLAKFHFSALTNANYFEDWFQRDLKVFKEESKDVISIRISVIDKIIISLNLLNEQKSDSAINICYDLLYSSQLSFDDSIMVHQTLGKIFYNINDYSGGLDHYIKASEIITRKDYTSNWLLTTIASIFIETDNTDSSLFYFHQIFKYPVKDIGPIYGNIASSHLKLNQLDSAFKYLFLSQSLTQTALDLEFVNNGLGDAYKMNNELDSAIFHYKLCVADTSIRENWYPFVKANVSLTTIYMDLGLYDSCTYYMDRFFLCPCLDSETKIWLHEFKANYYSKIGDLDKYYVNIKTASLIKDTLAMELEANIESLSQMNNARIGLVEENLKIKSENNKIIKERSKFYLIGVILLTISLILGVVFFVFRIKKNREIFNMAQELANSKMNEMSIAEDNLRLEIKSKNMGISQLATKLTFRREVMEEQKMALKELISTNDFEAIKSAILKRVNEIESYDVLDKQLNNLEGDVEEINNKLFVLLKEKYPSLTKGDIQVCALHLLNLETKEIAIIRNVTPKAIQISRYRIKKKLGLDETQGLIPFLESELGKIGL